MTWFRCDPDEFWDSGEVERLGFEAAGLLWWLISRAWRRGALHDDPELYRELIGKRCPNFDELWPKVRAELEVTADGTLRCPWLEEERDASIARLKNGTERKRQERLRKRSHAGVTRESHATETRQPRESRESHAPTDGRTEETRRTDVRETHAGARATKPERSRPDPMPVVRLRPPDPLNTPEVKAALTRWETHLRNRGAPGMTVDAWRESFGVWKSWGGERLIAAVGDSIRTNHGTVFEHLAEKAAQVNGGDRPLTSAELPRSGLLDMARTNRGGR